mgnify:CR=1 FL=1
MLYWKKIWRKFSVAQWKIILHGRLMQTLQWYPSEICQNYILLCIFCWYICAPSSRKMVSILHCLHRLVTNHLHVICLKGHAHNWDTPSTLIDLRSMMVMKICLTDHLFWINLNCRRLENVQLAEYEELATPLAPYVVNMTSPAATPTLLSQCSSALSDKCDCVKKVIW